MSKPTPIKQALSLPIAPVTASSVSVISRDGQLKGVSITVGYGSDPTFDKVTTGILSIVYRVDNGKECEWHTRFALSPLLALPMLCPCIIAFSAPPFTPLQTQQTQTHLFVSLPQLCPARTHALS